MLKRTALEMLPLKEEGRGKKEDKNKKKKKERENKNKLPIVLLFGKLNAY